MDQGKPGSEPWRPQMIRAAEDRLDWQENQEVGARVSAQWALVVMGLSAFVFVAVVAAVIFFVRHQE